MVPMALIGPATSGFTTASIIQSGVTSYANLAVKKTTGKTISKHIYDHISNEIYQTYLPEYEYKIESSLNTKKLPYISPIVKK